MTQIGANQLKKKKSVPVAPRLPPEKKTNQNPKKTTKKQPTPKKLKPPQHINLRKCVTCEGMFCCHIAFSLFLKER